MVKAEAVSRAKDHKTRKPFALKILTSNPSAINILQTFFANAAPSKPFSDVGGLSQK